MGRPSFVPKDSTVKVKLRLERLRFVNGDYDVMGAYWGGGEPIYYARGNKRMMCTRESPQAWSGRCVVEIFRRAKNREEAKQLIREVLPNATFYR